MLSECIVDTVLLQTLSLFVSKGVLRYSFSFSTGALLEISQISLWKKLKTIAPKNYLHLRGVRLSLRGKISPSEVTSPSVITLRILCYRAHARADEVGVAWALSHDPSVCKVSS